jgi:polyhydroxybutyrate depolymerase
MRDSVEVDGRTRTFTVVGGPARDLVLVFHGSGQTAETHRRFTGGAYDALAESGTAVVAYLDGYKRNWNDARRASRFPARVDNVDDVAFTRAVIDKLAATHGVERVFAAGYSNGGQMVIRLLHDEPALLTGAVIIAATLPAPENLLLPSPVLAPVPRPVVLVHGTKDPIVPYDGGEMRWYVRALFKVGGRALSMPDTARYFAGRNGIIAEPVVTRLPASGQTADGQENAGHVKAGRTWVERIEYRQVGRPPVTLYTVHGGGHTVPGPHDAPVVVGRTNHDINAADLVAELLKS